MSITKVIVIVCVSNTCRSPMVEYLLRDMIKGEMTENNNNYKVISRYRFSNRLLFIYTIDLDLYQLSTSQLIVQLQLRVLES